MPQKFKPVPMPSPEEIKRRGDALVQELLTKALNTPVTGETPLPSEILGQFEAMHKQLNELQKEWQSRYDWATEELKKFQQ
jgi:hypothetical protein